RAETCPRSQSQRKGLDYKGFSLQDLLTPKGLVIPSPRRGSGSGIWSGGPPRLTQDCQQISAHLSEHLKGSARLSGNERLQDQRPTQVLNLLQSISYFRTL